MIINKEEPTGINSVYDNLSYVYSTTKTSTQEFFYTYGVYDMTGLIFQGITVNTENKLSYNSIDEILESKISFNFNPSIKIFENVINNTIISQEKVIDLFETAADIYYDFGLKLSTRSNNENFNPHDYIMNGVSEDVDFLTVMPQEHIIDYDTDFTFRTFNGYVDPDNLTTTTNIDHSVFILKIDIVPKPGFPNIKEIKVISPINPYKNTTSPITILKNSDDNIIEIPVGLNNINLSETYKLIEYKDDSGGWFPALFTPDLNFNIDEDGNFSFNFLTREIGIKYYANIKEYDFYLEDSNYQRLSKIHNFKIKHNCVFNPVNISFENTLGGVDYFCSYNGDEKTVQTKKTIISRNSNFLSKDTEKIEKLPYSRESEVYNNNIYSTLKVTTDWLSQKEIDGLKDLLISKEVYIYYENKWQYVILLDKKKPIYNKKMPGFRQYTYIFQISKKINN